jgi:hypothetical protein
MALTLLQSRGLASSSIDRTWVGGGDNDASNPDNWSPVGTPEEGDDLLMPNGGTMNIQDNGLASNPLHIGNRASTDPPPSS